MTFLVCRNEPTVFTILFHTTAHHLPPCQRFLFNNTVTFYANIRDQKTVP